VAGLAGLAAAYELLKLGRTAAVFVAGAGLERLNVIDLPIVRLTPDSGADAASGALAAHPIDPNSASPERATEDERVSAALEQGQRVLPRARDPADSFATRCSASAQPAPRHHRVVCK
jgi:monoamine oxidase